MNSSKVYIILLFGFLYSCSSRVIYYKEDSNLPLYNSIQSTNSIDSIIKPYKDSMEQEMNAVLAISDYDFIAKLEEIGIGEIVINSIDNDGLMQGYDLSLIENIRKKCSMPITALGGASSLQNIKDLIKKFKIIGAAAGSLFVFKGKYRAVLINYPNRQERKPLY